MRLIFRQGPQPQETAKIAKDAKKRKFRDFRVFRGSSYMRLVKGLRRMNRAEAQGR